MAGARAETRGLAFEQTVADFFRSRGANVQHGVILGGQSVDLFVVERVSSGLFVRTVVEVKYRSQGVIGNAEVMNFVASCAALRHMGEADLFVMISSNGYTAHAREAARASGVQLLEFPDLELSDGGRGTLPSTVEGVQDKLSSATQRRTVFVSYSHRDRHALERLKVHLRPLEQDGMIELWADTTLHAGDDWRKEISLALGRARVAVILVSADFLASEFITANELPPLLFRAKQEGARVLPVILSSCAFARHEGLSHFQAVNNPSRPLADLSRADRERVWDSVAQEVIRSITSA